MTDAIDESIDPGYGIDAHLSADPDTGKIRASTLTLGDGGGQPFSIAFDPSVPLGEVMDALMQARGRLEV